MKVFLRLTNYFLLFSTISIMEFFVFASIKSIQLETGYLGYYWYLTFGGFLILFYLGRTSKLLKKEEDATKFENEPLLKFSRLVCFLNSIIFILIAFWGFLLTPLNGDAESFSFLVNFIFWVYGVLLLFYSYQVKKLY